MSRRYLNIRTISARWTHVLRMNLSLSLWHVHTDEGTSASTKSLTYWSKKDLLVFLTPSVHRTQYQYISCLFIFPTKMSVSWLMTTSLTILCLSIIYLSLNNIRDMRMDLTQYATKLLVQALVISHLNYCNSHPAYIVKSLQIVQNMTSGILSAAKKNSHSITYRSPLATYGCSNQIWLLGLQSALLTIRGSCSFSIFLPLRNGVWNSDASHMTSWSRISHFYFHKGWKSYQVVSAQEHPSSSSLLLRNSNIPNLHSDCTALTPLFVELFPLKRWLH